MYKLKINVLKIRIKLKVLLYIIKNNYWILGNNMIRNQEKLFRILINVYKWKISYKIM